MQKTKVYGYLKGQYTYLPPSLDFGVQVLLTLCAAFSGLAWLPCDSVPAESGPERRLRQTGPPQQGEQHRYMAQTVK